MRKQDYYQILMLNSDASDEEIKKAYRRIALECHPDHHPADTELEERFKRVSEAYSVLGDAKERKKYDLRLRRTKNRVEIFHQSDPEAMFWQFLEHEGVDVRKVRCFGGERGCNRKDSGISRNVASARDCIQPVHEISLTRVEAACGVRKKIIIDIGGNPKTYTFIIPPGVASGKGFRLVLDRYTQRSVLLRIRIVENDREVAASATESSADKC